MAEPDWLKNPVEGDYVETEEGLYFTVKGTIHPEGFIVAYLRYLPDPNGERGKGDLRYRRVYDIGETTRFLDVHFPQYLNRVESTGMALQTVPVERIARIHSPRERLKIIMERADSGLEQATVRFASALSSEGVPADMMGVSGSLLIGLDRPSSDVDLIVYGREAGARAYAALRELREGEKWIGPYDFETVQGVLRSRWGDSGRNLDMLALIEVGKVLHGFVDGREYFVRLVREPDAGEHGEVSRPMGTAVVRATIVDDRDSIYTPCTYRLDEAKLLEPTGGPRIRELVSFRGKFTEQAERGNIVEARGTLERVSSRGRTRHRLMLGSPGDYLAPL